MEIDMLRSLCLRMKGCKEDVKWENNLVFSVGEKMFCIANLDLPSKCSFKVRDEQFDEVSCKPGFAPAPYLARAKWVQITNPSLLHKEEWEFYIRQSYDLVKAKLTKRVRADLGLDH
jgi:predicted DNA-binding protein (MmcQ/YjbR family)